MHTNRARASLLIREEKQLLTPSMFSRLMEPRGVPPFSGFVCMHIYAIELYRFDERQRRRRWQLVTDILKIASFVTTCE